MIRMKRFYACKALVLAVSFTGIVATGNAQGIAAPAPFGLVPSAKQVEWYHREMQSFMHFNISTWYTQDWATPTLSPNMFNPRKLDCNQWMRILKQAGFKSVILTVKHCDGFCIWPSAYTTHSVKYDTSWMGGKGDVVQSFTDACHRWGIKPCFYVSPWDQNQISEYGNAANSTAYATFMVNQLRELLTNYGPVYEIWWDGATVGSEISETTFEMWADSVHKWQPQCIIWGDQHAAPAIDARWIGSEVEAFTTNPCWSTINVNNIDLDGSGSYSDSLGHGDLPGDHYIPAETNMSIQQGDVWFWHPNQTITVYPVSYLDTFYFTSVGRNTSMLLNNPPDTTGLLRPADSTAAIGMGAFVYGTFANNLLAGSAATALHTRGTAFSPSNMIDTAESTYFATSDSFKTDTITFVPPAAITFDCAMLKEVIQLGQRTTKWAIDAYYDSKWNTVVTDSGIGYKRAMPFSQVTAATQVRLRILGGVACPAINTFGVYLRTSVWPPVPDTVPNWNTAVAPRNVPQSDLSQNVLRIAGDRIVLPAGFGRGAVTVRISDLQGNCVRQITVQATGFEQRLAMPSLAPGLFLVRCSNSRLALEQKYVNLR
jgi:alpha-L-fucosidase